ncbi:MAG TPA: hypothetical protein VFG83_03305 [Kofleriaceae bacterium]|nr:hypothetical protein [Kofleriaceae bacterium]
MADPLDEFPLTDDPAVDRDDDDGFAELPKGVRQRLEAFIPELVRRTVTAGIGAVGTTEDSIRRIAKEMTLPKEMAGYLVHTAGATKDELLRIIAREVREFLQNMNLTEELAKILTTLSFEVKTEIRFIPNDEKYAKVEPNVRAKVRLKKNDRGNGRRRRRTSDTEPELPEAIPEPDTTD